jgi:hypothetical protein
MELINPFLNPPDVSFFLFCTRGMENSTFVTHCFSKLWLPPNSLIDEVKLIWDTK